MTKPKPKPEPKASILDGLQLARIQRSDAATARADELIAEVIADPRHRKYAMTDVAAKIREVAGLPPTSSAAGWMRRRIAHRGWAW